MQLIVRSSRLVVLVLLILVLKAGAGADLTISADPLSDGFHQQSWTLADFTTNTLPLFSANSTQLAGTPQSAAAVRTHAQAVASFHHPWFNRNVAVWCIVGALLVVTVLLAWLTVVLWRSGLGTLQGLAPFSATGASQLGPRSATDSEQLLEARARALAAEALANPETRTLRERMAYELAEFAKQSLVQGIYSQRNQLIEIQRQAQQDLAELEARLTSLHLPLQERLRAYEKRIAELEQELDTRDEEMRNMIHTTLLLVRQRMELEKATESGVNQNN